MQESWGPLRRWGVKISGVSDRIGCRSLRSQRENEGAEILGISEKMGCKNLRGQ